MKPGYLCQSMILAFSAFSVVAPPAHASGSGSHGGVAVVCRNIAGEITSAEILDLFEGRNQFGKKYNSQVTDPDTLIEFAELTMSGNAEFLSQFRRTLSEVEAGIVILPQGIGVEPTNDAFPTIDSKTCKFAQLARYSDDDSKIYVDEEIYKHLSAYDQAALLVHETIFKLARVNQGDTNSVRSRKLTSEVLATNADQGVIDSLMGALAVPKDAEPAPAKLQNGRYETAGNLCNVKIITSGKTLYYVEVAPSSDQNPADCTRQRVFAWGPQVVKPGGAKEWGFTEEMPRGEVGLFIEVLNDQAYELTGDLYNNGGSESQIYSLSNTCEETTAGARER